ncbi:MAG: hypothetical protein C4547_02940 [Phycisphaerales bacterium]|nr:MAG: hypothetical protein C4547_02940 [Phycisphaerales bacterium]
MAVRLTTILTCTVMAGLCGCRRGEPDKPASEPASRVAAPRAETIPEADRLNLLIVTIDTLRAQNLGCYGYFRDTSPFIDRLAERTIFFERCVAPVAQTLPSHTSIMTGTYPLEHGALSNVARFPGQTGVRFVPTPSLRTLAQHLHDQGYVTWGAVSAEPVKEETGIASGFDRWSEPEGKTRRWEETLPIALGHLSADAEPFFGWIHIFDNHAPYDLPEEYLTMYSTDESLEAYMTRVQSARRIELAGAHRPRGADEPKVRFADEQTNQYDGSIRYVDKGVEQLVGHLERTGLWEKTVFVLAADHGESLGEHNELGHGDIWNEQLHVPLMVHVPGESPRRVATAISLVDTMPTVLRLAEGRIPVRDFLTQCTGVDVLADPTERPLYFQRPGGKSSTFAIEKDGWKYIRNERASEADLLFQIANDPYELNNVIADFPERAAELQRELAQIIADQTARGERFAAGRDEAKMNAPMSAERKKLLEELGYVEDDDEYDADEAAAAPAAADEDGDGVPDEEDRCAGTPAGAWVNRKGCTPEQLKASGAAGDDDAAKRRNNRRGGDDPGEDRSENGRDGGRGADGRGADAGRPAPPAGRLPEPRTVSFERVLPPDVRNCLLITMDTTRADRIGPYAGDPSLTPNLSRLAAQGAVFLSALSQTNQTSPSHASIMSGVYALEHGCTDNTLPIKEDIDLLPLAFKRAGFNTAAFPSSAHVSTWIEWRGFDHLEKIPDISSEFLDAGEVTERATAWLEANGAQPFFAWVHYWDPHAPYAPPPEIARQFYDGDPKQGEGPLLTDHPSRSRFGGWLSGVRDEAYPRALYQGEIFNADRYVGKLLDYLERVGLADKTAVFFMGDHGENLGEHEMYYNHGFPFEETLRIPMIMRVPGMPSGIRVEQRVTQVDVLPTIAELFGLDVGNRLVGLSLVSALRGQPAEPIVERDFFVHEGGNWRQIVFRDGKLKCYYTLIRIKAYPPIYVAEDEVWIFDTEADPGESVNLAAKYPELIEQHRAILKPWMDGKLRWLADRAKRQLEEGAPLSEQRRELLERHKLLQGIGYVEDDDEEGDEHEADDQ